MDKKLEIVKYLRQYHAGNTEAIDSILPLCKMDKEALAYHCNKCSAAITSATRSCLWPEGARSSKQRLLSVRAEKILSF